MNLKTTWGDWVTLFVWTLPLFYLGYVYPQLPERVAVHFNLKGDPDAWGPRREMLMAVLLLVVVSLGVGLLSRFLPRIDPKKKVQYSQSTLARISYALVFFMSALNIVIIYSTLHGRFVMGGRIMFVVISLLFVYLGNQFNSLKPNYFIGIRTAWTLENETVWRKTHQWGGRLWVAGGLVMAVLTCLLPEGVASVVFLTGTVCLVLVPIVYSYVCYQQLQRKSI